MSRYFISIVLWEDESSLNLTRNKNKSEAMSDITLPADGQ